MHKLMSVSGQEQTCVSHEQMCLCSSLRLTSIMEYFVVRSALASEASDLCQVFSSFLHHLLEAFVAHATCRRVCAAKFRDLDTGPARDTLPILEK
jgi:hypothetical protein